MAFAPDYREAEPTRDEIDRGTGLMLLEFGAPWCGHCQALSPTIEEQLKKYPNVQHLRVADGRGKPLGRSFRVKLWPTLVFLNNGQVLAQLVRPSPEEARKAFEQLGDKRASA